MVEEEGGDTSGDGEWLTIAAAARRLRVSPRAIRGRIARGTIAWKPQGNTGRLVQVTGTVPSGNGDEDGPGDDAELELLREELTEARIAAARAEERAAALRELADRLTAELADARQPWWRRWRK